jgi:hypothetical protein
MGPLPGERIKSLDLNSPNSYAIPAETAMIPVITVQSTIRPVPEAARLTNAPTITDTVPVIRKYAILKIGTRLRRSGPSTPAPRQSEMVAKPDLRFT